MIRPLRLSFLLVLLPVVFCQTSLWADGFNNPCALRPFPNNDEHLLIVQRTICTITKVRIDDPSDRTEFLALDTGTVCEQSGGEQGLLDVNVHPLFGDGEHDFVYIYYTSQPSGNVKVEKLDATMDSANVSSRQLVIEIPQFAANHNGGTLDFMCSTDDCSDGVYLYIATGDGGGANDPEDNGQNTSSLLGKVLRLRLAEDGVAYSTEGNPFVGDAEFLDEIYAYGLRNPWRTHFDGCGTYWIADVGQNAWEEVDVLLPGDEGPNYGWKCFEGSSTTPGVTCNPIPSGTVLPIAEYAHFSDSCTSITGGVVYRGQLAPDWVGSYVFADYCTGDIFRLDGDRDQTVPVPNEPLEIKTAFRMSQQPTSFGMDNSQEMYIVTEGGGIYTLDGPSGSTRANFGGCGADDGSDGDLSIRSQSDLMHYML